MTKGILCLYRLFSDIANRASDKGNYSTALKYERIATQEARRIR